MKKTNLYITCNTEKCVECHACEASCKAVNHVEPGVKWRWVESIWEGEYPEVSNHSISIGCYHCKDAPCVDSCPSRAITQNIDGIVLVDSEKCEGNKACVLACPYNIPQFGSDGKMQKCNFCLYVNEKDDVPVCVKTCPAGALELGR